MICLALISCAWALLTHGFFDQYMHSFLWIWKYNEPFYFSAPPFLFNYMSIRLFEVFLYFTDFLFLFFFFSLPVFPSESCWSCFLKFTYFYSANCFGYSMSSYEIFHFSVKNSLWSQQPYVYLGEWCVYTICVSFSCFWYIYTHTCCVQYSAEYFREKY